MPISYPEAEPVPVTRTMGGVSFEDPDVWLEDNSDSALAWQAAQDTLASAHLSALPAYRRFAGRASPVSDGSELAAPRFAGGRWFRQVVPPGQSLPAIEVAEKLNGPGRRVFDLNLQGSDAARSISRISPSPDGRRRGPLRPRGGRRGRAACQARREAGVPGRPAGAGDVSDTHGRAWRRCDLARGGPQ